jgi:L-threonylcarbamoyladenylate synthase
MKTLILPATHPETLPRALEILRSGGLVALPTDTVYGLGALAFDEEAVKKIYIAKGRSIEKAIPILVGDPGDLEIVTLDLSQYAMALARIFWPGPLTLVVPKHPSIPTVVSATSSVGVRIPDQSVSRSLLRMSGPLAVTSANLSGRESPANAREVLAQLDGRIDLVIDAGQVGQGLASTVLDCLGAEPVILREGPVTYEMIKNALAASTG